MCFAGQSQISQINDSLMYGGRIRSYAKNSSCVLVTTNGGIFRTINQGQNWTNVTQTFDPNSVRCEQLVSVGADFYAMSNSNYGSGLYKSTNNGGTWTPLSFETWSPMTIGKLSNTLYAVGSNWSTGEGRLYASTDGNTWTPKSVIWTNYWPGGNIDMFSDNQSKLFLYFNENMYYTTDGNALTTISINGLSPSGFSNGDDQLAVDALGNLYYMNDNVIYKYNFTSETWSDIVTGKIPVDYQIMNLSVTENAIFFSAMPPMAAMKMYKSTDQGGTFTELASAGLLIPMMDNILEVANNTFIGNGLYEDIFFTSDGGASWTSNDNQYIATFAGGLTRSGNSLLYIRGNRGLILSGNLGANWAQANVGIPDFGGGIAYFLNELTQVKDTLFSFLRPEPFSDDVVLYKSSNFGASWDSCLIPAPYNAGEDYTFAGKCDSLLYVSYFDATNSKYALIASSTFGSSWIKPNALNSDKRVFLKGSKKCLFAFNSSDNDWDDFDNVYKANNFGMSFSSLNTENLFNSNRLIKRVYNNDGDKADPMMDFDMPNNRALFAVQDRTMYQLDKLYLYNITLSNWSELSTTGLPTNYIANCIKYLGNNVWILATNLGLYKSTNGGIAWTITHSTSEWQKGMIVNTMYKIDNKVFLGTISNGIWVVDMTLGGIEQLGQNQLQIFPNPASDILTVNLPDYNGNQVAVSVYNAEGIQLITETANAGQFRIDLHKLPSGIYFIQINANNHIYRNKIIRK